MNREPKKRVREKSAVRSGVVTGKKRNISEKGAFSGWRGTLERETESGELPIPNLETPILEPIPISLSAHEQATNEQLVTQSRQLKAMGDNIVKVCLII